MQNKTCKTCATEFTITAGDLEFYEKMGVQAPLWCPDCRFKRRAVWRNEKTLYKRICALCNRNVISMYHERAPHPVYCNDCWFSDKWDPKAYAMDYDFNRPFFDQLAELLAKVPQSATYSSAALGPNINSEYSNFAGANKDGYLVFNSGPSNENVSYSRGLTYCRDAFDIYFGSNAERTYEGINVHKTSGVRYAHNVNDSFDSWLLQNCSNCSNCFGCVNLRNGQYQFFNEQLSKEEYAVRVAEIVGSYAKLEEAKEKFSAHVLKYPRRENQNLKTVNSSGNYLLETKDCDMCFEVEGAENVKYDFSSKDIKDSMDVLGHGRKAELMYEAVGAGIGQRIIATWWSENSTNIEYSFAITGSVSDCVGGVALKNAKFMILNKQYEEAEYRKVREHIVNELKSLGIYGSFLPPQYSFFAYNETVGQDNMPMTKEQAIAEGFKWEDNLPETKGKETLIAENIPDHITDVEDSILNETLACTNCSRNYRLTKAELTLYRDLSLPIPRHCWQCRFQGRIKRRGPMKVFDRTCAKCNKVIKTSYAPDGPDIVYCESCFQAEVA